MIGNNPLISIIIPLYNAEKYISETIKSVIEQSYENWELLIVDDCSTDNSRAIVLEFADARIRLIESEVNFGGPARPRNLGIEASLGTYVAFLDADDVWAIDKLDSQIKLIVKEGLNFISSSAYLINEHSEVVSSKAKMHVIKKPITYSVKNLIFRNRIVTSSVVVHRSLLKKFQFREEKHFQAVEDYELWLNLLNQKNCKYLHLRQELVGYRMLDNSISHQNGRLKYAAKSMSAASQFLYESDNINLFGYLLWSNILRFIKLMLINR